MTAEQKQLTDFDRQLSRFLKVRVSERPSNMFTDKRNPPSKLSQHEVNKKIMAKDRGRLDDWMESTSRLYRDERLGVYANKKAAFLNAAGHYHDLNKLATMTNRTKLEQHYREMSFPFLENESESEVKTPDKYDSVRLLRIRHLRKAQEEIKPVDLPTCTLEPWFKRYVTLGKFIGAVRKVILKRRLLKNLELLKRVNDDNVANFETDAKICDNVSYPEVFQKFLDAPSNSFKPSFIETQSEEEERKEEERKQEERKEEEEATTQKQQ